jgi:biotin carboxyl carrier protein
MPGKNSKGNLPEPGRVWNLADIQELLDLLAGKEITEFEMEQQGVKIRVRRGNVQALEFRQCQWVCSCSRAAPRCVPLRPVSGLCGAGGQLPCQPRRPPAGAEAAAESTEGLFIMKSPIVGTFLFLALSQRAAIC